MDQHIIAQLQKTFEDCVHEQDGVEFWFARDLQTIFGYVQWRNFLVILNTAKESCANAGQIVTDHFADVSKKVKIGSGSQREIEDVRLTRYACYLIAQNGDPKKEPIAFAQSYFAIQTRRQELVAQRIALHERFQARNKLVASETELSKLIYERGVDDAGFARIRSKGDAALFGGHDTAAMKQKLRIPERRPLADFLPTVTIAAKNFATEITNFNVQREDLHGEERITGEHVKNNAEMRRVLTKNTIIPEQLPAEEDIRKLERRVKKDERTIATKKHTSRRA